MWVKGMQAKDLGPETIAMVPGPLHLAPTGGVSAGEVEIPTDLGADKWLRWHPSRAEPDHS